MLRDNTEQLGNSTVGEKYLRLYSSVKTSKSSMIIDRHGMPI